VKRESAASIALHQKPYAKEVFENFGMLDCKGSSYPIKAELKRSKKNGENRPTSPVDKPFDDLIYRTAVGSLLYLSTSTRPDSSYAVCKGVNFLMIHIKVAGVM